MTAHAGGRALFTPREPGEGSTGGRPALAQPLRQVAKPLPAHGNKALKFSRRERGVQPLSARLGASPRSPLRKPICTPHAAEICPRLAGDTRDTPLWGHRDVAPGCHPSFFPPPSQNLKQRREQQRWERDPACPQIPWLGVGVGCCHTNGSTRAPLRREEQPAGTGGTSSNFTRARQEFQH